METFLAVVVLVAMGMVFIASILQAFSDERDREICEEEKRGRNPGCTDTLCDQLDPHTHL